MTKASDAKRRLLDHIGQLRKANEFRLPAERVLADELGCSRATVGKALGVLEGEGIIIRKKGSGTFITDIADKQSTIALVLQNAYHYTNVHFNLIVEKASEYAAKKNVHIRIFDNLPSIFEENPTNNSLLKSIKQKKVDGVLITSRLPISTVNEIIKYCPAVSINNIFGDGNEFPCISCNYFRSGFIAGKHILKEGHKKVAYVTENLAHPETWFDFSGLKSALEVSGVEITKKDVLETKKNLHIFNENVINFFNGNHYTACYVRSSYYAAKMISPLRNIGITIPDDLLVVSGGRYGISTPYCPSLTVVDNKLDRMCEVGLSTLLDLINDTYSNEVGIQLLEPELMMPVNENRNSDKGDLC